MNHGGRAQAGSATVELVVLTPVLVALVGLVVFAGKVGEVGQLVGSAAQQAARAASLHPDPHTATANAATAAADSLADAGLVCATADVEVDTARAHPGGMVSVTVVCTADNTAWAFVGMPGAHTFTATADEPIDRYRAPAPVPVPGRP